MPIELEILKNERDRLRESLRETEAEVRRVFQALVGGG